MRWIIYILVLFGLHGSLPAQIYKMAADTEFFYGYGGTSYDEARSIQELPGGGFIIAGTSSSFGQGNTSVYLVKTDKNGKHLWSYPYGGGQNDWAHSIHVTADSGYFVAGFSNSFGLVQQTGYDAYYFKTDKNGTLQWQRTIAGEDWDFIYGSVAMPDGGFVLCGETYTQANGGTDAYLVRLAANGDTVWTRRYGGKFNEAFNTVCIMNNQLYALGKNCTQASDTVADAWLVKLDTNGNVLKEVYISGPGRYEEIGTSITPYSNNLFHFCGRINLLDSNSVIPFLYRADTSLSLTIVPNYLSTAPGNAVAFNRVINTSYGSICVVGSAIGGLGGYNLFFIGYDASGAFINNYIRHSGGTKDEFGYDGIRTSDGQIVAVGSEESFCSGNTDAFLVRFNSDSISNSAITATQTVCFTDTLFLWPTGISTNDNALQVQFYPNPVTSTATLRINESCHNKYTATLTSVSGLELLNVTISSNTSVPYAFAGVPNGSYFLKISDQYGQVKSVLKFVVQK